ncbi:hypothetical protein CDL12_20785 [Handroanthus impetiginosus]|uniref:Uncharacterized protein n=1 Tax=Handroanthus impetiginosus TaxID=429701 RepID=A0A2G9GMY4_9LAMI|nr:hypothetical protein CDL12_20785 [Handroanthus impetiginosus]
MAVEVLAPQNLLVEKCHKQPRSYHRRRNFPAKAVANQKHHRQASPKPNKSKIKAPSEAKKLRHGGDTYTRRVDVTSSGIVMGQVRLLRRGESLSSVVSKISAATREAAIREPVNDLAVSGMASTEPDSPVVIPQQIRRISAPPAAFYAGSACHSSPSPRALPLPSFFKKDGIAKHLGMLQLQ